jgi:tetrahydromethanopterin S-methyltransferase subunit G
VMTVASLPLPLFFAATVAVVLACIALGYRVGRYRRASGADAGEPVGGLVGAVLGLLAFMLAFTFGSAAGRFDARKQLLLNEVNAIGTAMLRTEMLAEPHRAESRRMLKRYVTIRAGVGRPETRLPEAIAESEAIQKQLWAQAIAGTRGDGHPNAAMLMLPALNEVFDLHTSRLIVGLQYKIPQGIWIGLLFITVLAMVSVGYQLGFSNTRNMLVPAILAVSFSTVVLLIADLDRATSGGLTLSQQPMVALEKEFSTLEP